jgi:mRNA-degrading endonuclease toxin of MazEF toxin-antitoxin module
VNYIPEKGDIVSLNFNPSSGKEIYKRRLAIVISRRLFNQHTGFAIVAPITSTIRNMDMEVILTSSLKTRGAILVHQIKSLDFQERKIKLIEKAPKSIIEQVTKIAQVIID